VSAFNSVVVAMPAFEEDGIGQFIREIKDAIGPEVSSLRFVVVDDASQHAPVSHGLGESCQSDVDVHVNDRNVGHGVSVLRAYQAALQLPCEAIIHVDGDGQISGAELLKLLHGLESADVVLARRMNRGDPWFRQVLTRFLSLMLLPWTRGLRDANTPFRAYRPAALRGLLGSIPPESPVPHLNMSMCLPNTLLRVAEVRVDSRVRLGRDPNGTSWQSRGRLVPSRRLVRFCFRSLPFLWARDHASAAGLRKASADLGADV
jgi:dolichol-phosphate mannosyltransferase